ncbi:hypothetical protein [Luteolibacter sp. LG18]|uniref:hypothetical protein n=1 Tax=Luteolibacter sp. LG18 TaxID=2819286 RepID=UPI002B293B08|nr:hypothetical protein llg_26990 [Luteolibacter sp. LG18]
MTKAEHIITTRRALSAEDVNFTTYSLMMVLSGHPGQAITVNQLGLEAGMSYHATRNQLRRTPWFRTTGGRGSAMRVSLAQEGAEKLARIEKRISR